MAAKGAGGAGAGAGGAAGGAGNGSKIGGLHLKLQPPPPKSPFASHPFSAAVYLMNDKDAIQHTKPTDLVAELLYDDDRTPVRPTVENHFVVNDGKNLSLDAKGKCTLKMVINEVSMHHANRAFVMCIRPADSSVKIQPCFTAPMVVIRARLTVTSSLPDKWYKDEGGRDKCMEVKVELQDANGQTIKNRPLQLNARLAYEDETEVTRQNILRITPETRLAIDSSGRGTIRFRIDDVSKNHQNQKFRVKISPATESDPSAEDVAPEYTGCVAVRSKRNKKPKPLPAAPGSSAPLVHHSYSARAGAGAPAATLPRVALGELAGTSRSGSAQHSEALNRVIEWSNSTVQLLQHLEWPIVAYEIDSNGAPRQSMPIRRCPGCLRYADGAAYLEKKHGDDCPIKTCLLKYSEEALPNLHTLVEFVHGAEAYKRAATKAQAASAGAGQYVPMSGGNPSGGTAAAKRGRPPGNSLDAAVPPPLAKQQRPNGLPPASNGGGMPLVPSFSLSHDAFPVASGALAMSGIGAGPGDVVGALAGSGAAVASAAMGSGVGIGMGVGSGAVVGGISGPAVSGVASVGHNDAAGSLQEAVSFQLPPRPGSLNRGISLLFESDPASFSGMLTPGPSGAPLQRGISLGLGMDFSEEALSAFPPSEAEQEVAYILSKVYRKGGIKQLPAFNETNALIGVYHLYEADPGVQATGTGDATECSFIDINDLKDADLAFSKADVVREFLSLKSQNSPYIHSVADHAGNIKRCSEAAVFHLWSSR